MANQVALLLNLCMAWADLPGARRKQRPGHIQLDIPPHQGEREKARRRRQMAAQEAKR